jgi:hypothetical protein
MYTNYSMQVPMPLVSGFVPPASLTLRRRNNLVLGERSIRRATDLHKPRRREDRPPRTLFIILCCEYSKYKMFLQYTILVTLSSRARFHCRCFIQRLRLSPSWQLHRPSSPPPRAENAAWNRSNFLRHVVLLRYVLYLPFANIAIVDFKHTRDICNGSRRTSIQHHGD